MKLTPEQLKQFDDDGYLFFPGLFQPDEVATLNAAVPELYARRAGRHHVDQRSPRPAQRVRPVVESTRDCAVAAVTVSPLAITRAGAWLPMVL